MSTTEHQWAEEAAEQQANLLGKATTWWTLAKDHVRHIAEGNIERPVPTLWQRDDGAFLVYPGRSHIFMGEPESCKTWQALVVVAQEIRAGNAALYVDLEDEPITAVERLLQLGLSVDEIADGFLYMQPGGPFDLVAGAHVDMHLGLCDRPVTVAVIDSMTEAMALNGGDPDKGTDVARFYHGLPKTLMLNGLAVIMIDHVTKSNDNRGRWAIGSERKISGITGAAYAFAARVPFGRGMTGKVDVTLSKDRVGSVRPLGSGTGGKHLGTVTLTSDKDTGAVSVTFAASAGTPVTVLAAQLVEREARLRREMWQVISEDEGIGSTEMRKRVTGASDAKDETREWLIENGYVETRKVGKTTGHYVVKALPPTTTTP